MKKYIQPEIELNRFESDEDVMVASVGQYDPFTGKDVIGDDLFDD